MSKTSIFIYCIDLPPHIHEMVVPGMENDFTIYLDIKQDQNQRIKSFIHAMKHIDRGDFDEDNVQTIEINNHHRKGA